MPDRPQKSTMKFKRMSDDERAQFYAELEKFKPRWDLMPAAYQIRNPDGSPGGWIAQVRVIENRSDAMVITPLLEKNVAVYESEERANSIAMLMGLGWLKNKAMPRT